MLKNCLKVLDNTKIICSETVHKYFVGKSGEYQNLLILLHLQNYNLFKCQLL